MTGFYSSIIFIGVVIMLASLIWIAVDKKNVLDTEARMDEKKTELIRLVNDAEMMIEELNKFSDYVVTQIEEKSNEINLNFTEAQNLLEVIKKEKANLNMLSQEKIPEVAVEAPVAKKRRSSAGKKETAKKDIPSNDKVVSINSKQDEVLMLAHNGLDETEIARKLNIGKGEIQLILGVNR